VQKEKPADSAGGLSNQSRHWTGAAINLKVTRSALSFILTTAKIIVKNPAGVNRRAAFQQKAATAGRSGDGFPRAAGVGI
jgi:hypothetical protein